MLAGLKDAAGATTCAHEPTFNQVAGITDPFTHTTTWMHDSTNGPVTITVPVKPSRHRF